MKRFLLQMGEVGMLSELKATVRGEVSYVASLEMRMMTLSQK